MRRPFLLASALAVSGCVAGPPPEIGASLPVLPNSFAFAPDTATSASLAALLPLGDPAYASLSTLAVQQAPTLSQAAARIEIARANAARAGVDRLPILSGDASITATRTNPHQFGTALPPGIAIDTERVRYGANVVASWDPDLFGRLRNREDAAQARLDAATFEAVGVRNAFFAEIATSVIDWRTLEARRAALEEDTAAADELARLAGVRERAGIAPGFDRVRAESAARASRSRIEALASERARIAGRLTTLTGVPAQTVLSLLAEPADPLAAPPPPLAMPSDLLTNRPDVLAAEANLRAEDAELAATAARRFPQLTLSAALGLLAFDLGGLFDADAIVGSAGPSLLAPLLDFGRIEAEIEGAAAEKRLAFAQYRDAVFSGLGDAETGYGLIAAADRELTAAEGEAASQDRAARLADTRYRAGLADFLTVLEARRAADGSAERAAAARGRALRARVFLWRALGGDPVRGLE
ncbi:efflux transporter outer membrane subunit [Altererythrobacter sp. HHU K3-1]|uniref:Efflux transporter outer membrane subunit n=2 Tax=Qipengyuania atrilutea TaxID=2744473 RepID=A0A850H649_9SPHN|nr:efflux transporter outer membrane subunit [Actirhodobacter atriluteus]